MASTDTANRAELASVFKNAVADHEEVMNECLSMLRTYGLSAQDLFFKYEAFLLSRPSGLRAKLSTFTLDVARELRKEIQRETQSKAAAAAVSTPGDKALGVRKKAGVADLGGFLDGLTTPVRKSTVPSRLSNTGNNANLPSPSSFATPSRTPTGPVSTASSYRPGAGPSRLAPHATPLGKSLGVPSSPISGTESPNVLVAQSAQPFRNRPQPHQLLETLNPHLSAGTGVPPGGSRSRVALGTPFDPATWDYRYMFEKISARSEALDEQIDEFGEFIKQDYELYDLGDPHLVSEESIYTVGRILSPPTDNAKATTTSLFLQSSRMLGGGKVISIRFAPDIKVRGGAAGVRGFGLFPGMLIGVKGRNGGGDVFVVEEVLVPQPLPLQASPPSELIEYQRGERLNGLPFSLFTASGPYTLDDNLLYEPLDALVDVVCDERPDVLVMIGPFVDAQHPHILSGKLAVSPIDLFREQIAARIARIHEVSPATFVFLVPSVRDLVSRHAAYPQARLEKEGLGLGKKAFVMPNPCMFSVNEVQIAASSADVLFHLRKEEVFQRAEEAEPDPKAPKSANPQGDAMANLVRHVLGQKHFYPLFPAPESVAHEVNLDVTHWHQLRLGDYAPDVFILPSKLKHFSKIVDSTLAINPGHLSRAHSAGTFAKVTIHPSSKRRLNDGDADVDEPVEHYVFERARSEVWRI